MIEPFTARLHKSQNAKEISNHILKEELVYEARVFSLEIFAIVVLCSQYSKFRLAGPAQHYEQPE